MQALCGHFVRDMCYDESRLCAQIIGTILGWIVNTLGRAYVKVYEKEILHLSHVISLPQFWFYNLEWPYWWFIISKRMEPFLL